MHRLLALVLLVLATPVVAQDDISSAIAAHGLRATEADLATRTAPTPSERFALGGVRFLAGIERALQLRYRVGLGTDMAEASGLPILRLPIEENPQPEPFEPAMIEALFRDIGLDMAGALDALSGIGDSDAVAVEIRTEDLWFDIDSDGTRQPGEGVLEITGWTLSAGNDLAGLPSTTIRFDAADSAWLSAYAHLLSAMSEAVLALGPTDGIARVLEARATFDSLGRPKSGTEFTLEAQGGQWVDLAAMWIMAIEGQPDPVHTRALRDHLLAVVSENRRFWSLVPREQDNNQEWIPNKNQTSATGLPFPPGTGARWLAVLRDGERILQGELLIPYWRVGSQAGLNLAALFENPPEIDIAGVIQGATLLPYLEEGPIADGQSLQLFGELVQGDSPLYAVLLN
ncbi:hypothetical protein FHG66_03405 [Rubellimicrobium rubrum]|uniref:Uncharacterized protein n=1 Tax=Rubellimicrobium rubrum TaxID=2585369 RepID=A0A5C4N678_9RHOB|nr:hypothetical protein [Rubellimicrobium rubrum]TNC51871.1 hypothetical protein FHG66_03405 [Rubellimicrobium rubrum]